MASKSKEPASQPQSQLKAAGPSDPYDPGAMELALADVVELLGDLADQDTCPGCGSDGDDGEDHATDCPIMAMLAQLKPYAEGIDRFNAIEPVTRRCDCVSCDDGRCLCNCGGRS